MPAQGDYSRKVAAAMAGDAGAHGPCECRAESAAEAAATKVSDRPQRAFRARLSAMSRFAELVREVGDKAARAPGAAVVAWPFFSASLGFGSRHTSLARHAPRTVPLRRLFCDASLFLSPRGAVAQAVLALRSRKPETRASFDAHLAAWKRAHATNGSARRHAPALTAASEPSLLPEATCDCTHWCFSPSMWCNLTRPLAVALQRLERRQHRAHAAL